MTTLSARSRPTGRGSRGGTIHLPGQTARYARAWRAAHPDYREREMLRRARSRAVARGEDPALVTSAARRGMAARQLPSTFCGCGCGCRAEVVTLCGFCRDGMHGGDE